jgi:hypothetical protein
MHPPLIGWHVEGNRPGAAISLKFLEKRPKKVEDEKLKEGIRMRLKEVEYMTDSKVEVTETVTNQKVASLRRCEVKEGGFLRGACGFGATARDARKALASAISEQTLIKNAYGDRMEWKLPKVTA